ncbi:MAG: glycosyltransferase family 1 protein [Candidatus Gracilibacteria bacterium]
MKIGIDIRTACGKKAGKGQYTFNTVKELLKQDNKNEYILYANAITGDLAAFGNAHIKVIDKKSLFWHFAVIKDFKKHGGDVFFAPTSFIIPAFLPRKIKSIITVHDLVSFLHPNLHQAKATILEHLFFRMAMRKTAHILVPSHNTKNDLMKMFRCTESKITVTHLGVSEKFFRIPENLKAVKEKYNLPDNFILTVSGLEPRKNISALVDAVSSAENLKGAKLVIVGSKGWKSEKLQQKIAGLKNSVHHILNCEDDELAVFYHLAKIFVYPSLYEGFGLPPLEAMASGCPVICSNISSLPEVCGNAALMFNPNSVDELKSAIEKLLADEKLRAELKEKGLLHAKNFTWQKTAEKTLSVLKKLTSL